MRLDLPTVMTMESFVIACAGIVLLYAWSQHKTTPAIGLWGAANLFCAGGILSLMLGLTLRQPVWSILAGSLLVLAPALMWKAARSFDAKPTPLLLTFLGPAVMGFASLVPGLREITGSLGSPLVPCISWLRRSPYGSAAAIGWRRGVHSSFCQSCMPRSCWSGLIARSMASRGRTKSHQ
jgi:hypothetical protein